MSIGLTNIVAVGNLTKDPEIRYSEKGVALTTFSLAVNTFYSGQDHVDFFQVRIWGKVAEACHKCLSKGSGVVVQGSLNQNRWEKDGKQHSSIVINGQKVSFIGGGPKKESDVGGFDGDDDIPF